MTAAARALRDARRGSVSLEFAVAGPVLLFLIFAIIENGLMLFAGAVLDNATRTASRQIMIGSVTTSAAFRAAICNSVTPFFDCTRLQFNVQAGTAFPAGVQAPSSNGSFSNASFATGSAGQFVLIEVAYDRAYISPWIISIAGSGQVLLSVQAFQNEPFS